MLTFALDAPKYDVRRGRSAVRGSEEVAAVSAAGARRTMGSYAHIGAAVIGSGFIGTVHIEALRRIGVHVTGLLQSSRERGDARAAELGVPRAYTDLDELLDD